MHTATTTPVSLGVIGIHENQLLHTDFQVTSIPQFKKRIRVQTTVADFNKNTFKTYISASRDNKQQMTYVDSLETKPQFLSIALINNQYKQYELSLMKNGQVYKTIDFGDCTIFGYQLSYFCWGENDKKRVELFDIVDEKDSCPKRTYKKAEKAKYIYII